MPMNRTPSRAAITPSVAAAFLDSGGLNAGTPVAIASVPVRATAPAAKARRTRIAVSGWIVPRHLVAQLRGVGAAFAEDEDPEDADRDHQQGRADEQVGRDGEDVASLAQAAEVAQRDQGQDADPDQDALVEQARERRRDLLDRRCRRDGDRHHVVDQEGRRGHQRDGPADVPFRHRVRPATGRVGDADLAVAQGDGDQQDGDGDADLEAEGHRGGPAEDQHPQDLLGRVGRRADGVGAEDRQGLLLGEPLAQLVFAHQRAPDEEPADRRPGLPRGRRRRAGRLPRRQLAPARVAEVRCVRSFDADATIARLPALQRAPSSDHAALRVHAAVVRPIVGAGQPPASPPRLPRCRTRPDARSRCRPPCPGSGSSPADRRRVVARRCPGLSSRRPPAESDGLVGRAACGTEAADSVAHDEIRNGDVGVTVDPVRGVHRAETRLGGGR